MKTKLVIAGVMIIALMAAFTKKESKPLRPYPKGCVFRTVMGEESSENMSVLKTEENVVTALDQGLSWMLTAQNEDGGWGAGTHARQDLLDPHAVSSDPATTSMVAMALLRAGSKHDQRQTKIFNNAVEYLLKAVEQSSQQSLNITDQTGTQIQIKLGGNIDVILASQFFSNLLDQLEESPMKDRVRKANSVCVNKIQKAQGSDGSMTGSGWAGVLQSAFAANALESAQRQHIAVDDRVLAQAKTFQKNNYNATTGDVKTDMGAGVVLYSVSGSSRASAKEARRVRELMDSAKTVGALPANAPASAENLRKIGINESESRNYATAYEVYESAKVKAQRDDVMDGFGSNGGEEFLSYLQTGEGMVVNKDTEWTKWYDNISGRLLKIQNDDGSWNGHHCITSPVFCTATCMLILSVNNDIDRLTKLGGK
jgi:hypothetical protein